MPGERGVDIELDEMLAQLVASDRNWRLRLIPYHEISELLGDVVGDVGAVLRHRQRHRLALAHDMRQVHGLGVFVPRGGLRRARPQALPGD